MSFWYRPGGPAQHGAGGELGVDRVALTEPGSRVRVRLVDLDDTDPFRDQLADEAGRVGAGRLDSDPVDLPEATHPLDQLSIPVSGRRERGRAEQPALPVDDSDVVLVGVRVDTRDHRHPFLRHSLHTVPSPVGAAGRDGRTQQ